MTPLFTKLKAEGKTSKAPIKESLGNLRNWKIILTVLFGAAAGQAVIWYVGQFYALFFLQNVLKVEFVTATPRCVADVDDGSFTGTPDGGVTIDDMFRGAHRLKVKGTPIQWGPGRHTAGNNTFLIKLPPDTSEPDASRSDEENQFHGRMPQNMNTA